MRSSNSACCIKNHQSVKSNQSMEAESNEVCKNVYKLFHIFSFSKLKFSDTRYRCILVSLYRKMTNYEKFENDVKNLLRKTERSSLFFASISNSSNWFDFRT